jgi:hypothetical protein
MMGNMEEKPYHSLSIIEAAKLAGDLALAFLSTQHEGVTWEIFKAKPVYRADPSEKGNGNVDPKWHVYVIWLDTSGKRTEMASMIDVDLATRQADFHELD